MGVNPADLAGLTVEEKLDLISELWDSIESSTTLPSLTEAQSQELVRRRAEGLSDPGVMIDWSAVRQDLGEKPWRFLPSSSVSNRTTRRTKANLMLRSHAKRGVSKHGLRHDWCPPFETRPCGPLLRVRSWMIRS
jgi:putative addiction module component (TIGR02574 family)